MKKTIFFLTLSLCLVKRSAAQHTEAGQLLPIPLFAPVYNDTSSAIRLQDLQGKLVILNFWNTGCISCIREFGKIDSLQALYRGKIQFLLVSAESRDSLIRFFTRHPKIVLPRVPFITDGRSMIRQFPKDGYPYDVWIDGTGMVRYITASYNTTREHIAQFLKGIPPSLHNYSWDKGGGRDLESIPENQYHYYSAISACSHAPVMGSAEGVLINEGAAVALSSPCESILDLYKKAFRERNRYRFTTPAQLVLRVRDSSRYIRPADPNLWEAWMQSNLYRYELVLPAAAKEQRYRFMQQDLQRYFGLNAHVEKRKVSCYVLIKKKGEARLRSSGGIPIDGLQLSSLRHPITDTIRLFQNKPFWIFADHISSWVEYNLQLPFVDSTNLSGNIDVRLHSQSMDPFNLEALKKDLGRYHLDLVRRDCFIDVLVLQEK